jgi:hypothetical protein
VFGVYLQPEGEQQVPNVEPWHVNALVPPHVPSVEAFLVAVAVAAVEVFVVVTSVEARVVVEVEMRVDDELDTTGATLNVLNEVICQNAFLNAVGFSATYFLQASMLPNPAYLGHELSPYTFPAQSPQNVVSKMNLWFLNLVSMLQPPSKLEIGVPNKDVSGASAVMLAGILPRGKNHILIAVLVHSIA